MLELHIRPVYQKICISPLLKILPKFVTPLQVTLLAGVMGVLSATLIVVGHSYLAILCLLFSGYCDTLDGSLARAKSQTSELGSMSDIICDRVVEFAIILGLYLVSPISRGIPCFAMLGAVLLCVTTFLVVGIFVASSSEKSFHYSPGLIERAEAFLFFIAMVLFPGYFSILAWLFVILVCLTIILHIYAFWKYQRSE